MQQPRQMYGLGSLVKKAVKGVTGAVKGVASGVKDFAKSDAGKLALLAGGAYFAPTLFGKPAGFGSLGSLIKGGISNIGIPAALKSPIETFKGMGNIGKAATLFGVGALGGGALQALEAAGVEDPETEIRDVDALKSYLRQGYIELNPNANPQEVEEFVEANTVEYRAEGGRIGYAFGSPEENAMQASGIMGLPLNQNPAGVTELDLRDSGGFIPPVGVKEKADDIPAMLSNNEFVFTADAVRGMGDGDVNKGAQRMYDMMKKLENGGRV
jgi:hypothetical protein